MNRFALAETDILSGTRNAALLQTSGWKKLRTFTIDTSLGII
ncbi:MAG: hypothetical protein OXR66_02520 [Candidatus Woesearchaeota archaeon]|nr:hypothetical protein [Candidatus Woesearchaeota archaeon]